MGERTDTNGAAIEAARTPARGYTATIVDVRTSQQNAQIAGHPAEFGAVADSNRVMVRGPDRAITVGE